MRFAIIGTVLATVLSISAAHAQASKPETSGSAAYCAVNANKANCSFATAELCQKEISNMGPDGKGFSCVERSKL